MFLGVVLIPLNRVICIEYHEDSVISMILNNKVLIPLNRVICIECCSIR